MSTPDPTVLYRDAWILAVDKPAGVIVHGDGTSASTLTDAVRNELLQEGSSDEAANLQALNRLDRDTTGIVLFSVNKETQSAFDALVAGHGLDKHYLAIAQGELQARDLLIDKPLGRDRHDARRMRISNTGKPAQTRITTLATRTANRQAPACTLLDVELLTGRKHQIRVHLASLGHPLLGDTLYGGPTKNLAGKRIPLILHAHMLSFKHPATGEPVHITSPVPSRIIKLFPTANL